MRDIKFRVWDKDSNKIYSQDDFILTFDVVGEDIYLSKNDKIIPLYRYELMQYTGLKDKNGKEIYEGDIFKNCGGLIKLVVWKDNGFKAKYTFKRRYQGEEWNEHSFTDLRDTESKRWGVEIIGNIYENKDLLEK